MTEREWKPGDKALLPVTIVSRCPDTEPWWEVDVGSEEDGYRMSVRAADLIPDERRPEWLPGQPGDITEVEPDGERVVRGTSGWWFSLEVGGQVWRSDHEVPAGARLLLPARTREVTS